MFKAEMQSFFILDTCRCVTEYDDPKDAILFFSPPHVPESYQCTLSCQLMGVVEFYGSFFSLPKILKLEGSNYAIRKCEKRYLLCLSGSSDTSDCLLSDCLDFMYGLFIFYHGSIDMSWRDSQHFKSVWSSCITAVLSSNESRPAPIFSILPWFQTTEKSLYLRAAHLVQSCARYPWYQAGCLFYNGQLVFTQLDKKLTAFLSFFRQGCIANSVAIAKDISFATVYISHSNISSILRDEVQALTEQEHSKSRSNSETSGESCLLSDKEKISDYNFGSEESLSNTLDSGQSFNSSSDFPDDIQKGFCDSFDDSLTLIHKVTCDSLERLSNVCSVARNPRYRKKSRDIIGNKISHYNDHSLHCNPSKQRYKKKSVEVKSPDRTSCDSSFFETSHINLEKYPIIPTDPFFTQNLCLSVQFCNDSKSVHEFDVVSKLKNMNSSPILLENDTIVSPLHQTKSTSVTLEKMADTCSGEQKETSSTEKESTLGKNDQQSLSNRDNKPNRFSDPESSSEDMVNCALYVFHQGETDLCLLMNSRVDWEIASGISKTTEKPLKKMNELLKRVFYPHCEEITDSHGTSFSIDNRWGAVSGKFTSDCKVVPWGTMREYFSMNPLLKCLTVMNLKGTAYAHSSVTHDVFNSAWDLESYTPGVPSSQSSMCKIVIFPKQSFNKLGYFLLK